MRRLRYIKDRVFAAAVVAASLLFLIPLFHMVAVIIVNGLPTLLKAGVGFFTDAPPPPLSGEIGGIAPALVGSFLVTTLSLLISIPLALCAAILSSEFPNSHVARAVDVLSRSFASIPTIVVSMVVYATIVVPIGSFSVLAGAIALSLVSLPYAYTSFSTSLKAVPRIYREAAYSIGMNRWKTVFKVLVPIARKAIVVGVLVTFARAMGETAALLFTAGRYRAGVTLNITSPTDAIPLLIFDYMLTPFKLYHEIAWGATLVLLIMYILVFAAVKTAVKEVRL